VGHVDCMEIRNTCKTSDVKQKKIRPLGRHRLRWNDNMEMEIGCEVGLDTDQGRALVTR